MNYLKSFLLTLALLLSVAVAAQVTMGSLEEPNKGALLDLTQGLNQNGITATKGLQLPRVELYHLQRLKMGDFEITDPDEKLQHTGLTVYHIPSTTKSSALTESTSSTKSDLDVRQDIPAGVYYWDGEKWGRYGGITTEKPSIELSVTPSLMTFGPKETGVKYYTVTVTGGAKWSVTPTNDPNWSVTPSEQNGTIAIYPYTVNQSVVHDKTITLSVIAQKTGSESVTAKVSAVQEKEEFIFDVNPKEYSYEWDSVDPIVFNITMNNDPGKLVNFTFEEEGANLYWDANLSPQYDKITIAPRAINTSTEPIVHTVTINGYIGGLKKSVTVTLTHKAKPIDYTADLSLPNSYIVSKADTRFAIPIKKAVAVWKADNWKAIDTNNATYSLLPEGKDVDLMQNLTAKVLWYDTPNIVKGISIEGTGADRNMILDVSGIEGNAVVALYGDDGKILWSWHIWSTDQPAEQKFALLNNNIWMDRNLGATEATTRSNGSSYKHKGLLYQWGRKDPFPGSNSYSAATRVPIYLWDGSSYTTISSNYPTKAVADYGASIDAPGQRLKHTIEHPVDFMTTTGTDWYFLYKLLGGDKTRLWSDRWGDTSSSAADIGPKSVMDPCPQGWRVPYPTGGIVQLSPWGETFTGVHETCEALTYGGQQYGFRYKEADEVFYPTTGQLKKETGEMQVDDGSESGSGNPRVVSPITGTYWNSGGTIEGVGALGEFKGNTLFIANPLKTSTTGSGSSDAQFTEFRAAGAAVRCIKDTYNYNK